jgi:hypothetical protein
MQNKYGNNLFCLLAYYLHHKQYLQTSLLLYYIKDKEEVFNLPFLVMASHPYKKQITEVQSRFCGMFDMLPLKYKT